LVLNTVPQAIIPALRMLRHENLKFKKANLDCIARFCFKKKKKKDLRGKD
jgi:hypothetical protein